MGYASRLNPNATAERQRLFKYEAELRAMLDLFPDRATFEAWATDRHVSDECRAWYERFLPARLQAVGSV